LAEVVSVKGDEIVLQVKVKLSGFTATTLAVKKALPPTLLCLSS
jgi:hypothetical protein